MTFPLRKDAAFTLTELLVVLVIMLIVAVLGVPAVMKTRQAALSAGCLNHQRQLGAGFMAYAAENAQWLPPAMQGSSFAWKTRITPYVGAKTVFICPAHQPTAPKDLSYGYNIKFGNVDASGKRKETYSKSASGYYELHHLLRFRNRSLTTMLIDLAHEPGTPNYNSGKGPMFYYDGQANPKNYRHNGRMNVLWVDGHVSSVSPDEVKAWANGPQWSGKDNYDP